MQSKRNKFTTQMARTRAHRFGTPIHKALLQATEQVTGRDDFLCGTKHSPVAHARGALMCAARMAGATLEECALFAGLYDHSSASNAIQKSQKDDKLKADAEAIFEKAQTMLIKREEKFAEGINDMILAIEQKVGSSEPEPKIKAVYTKPKPKSLRPDVEALRRKPWEEDTPEGREIARKRDQYYG